MLGSMLRDIWRRETSSGQSRKPMRKEDCSVLSLRRRLLRRGRRKRLRNASSPSNRQQRYSPTTANGLVHCKKLMMWRLAFPPSVRLLSLPRLEPVLSVPSAPRLAPQLRVKGLRFRHFVEDSKVKAKERGRRKSFFQAQNPNET